VTDAAPPLTWEQVEERLNRETLFRPEDVRYALEIARRMGLTPPRALELGFECMQAAASFDQTMASIRSAVASESLGSREIGKAYRVPYWIVSDEPRPSWLRSPLWRFRALWWRPVR
jgi:hypothetical protein